MDPDLIDRLREDLLSADYRAESVRSALGAAADEARERGVFTAARSALAARAAGPLGSLIRLFLLGETLEYGALGEALHALGVRGALELGLVEEGEGGVRAAVSLNPVEVPALSTGFQEGPGLSDWWILSDLDDQLRRGSARSDHVMGVGGATRSLLAQAVAHGDSALDLGTGCGIVALALARAGIPHVVATDISRRALGFARANARLAGLDDRIEFRLGDLFEPLRGGGGVERFDLILSNPPFVITPREEAAVRQYEYRDGGMVGDDLARTVVSRAPEHLNPGGILLCLANWESRWGESGRDRVRAWLEECATGPLSAWVIERDLVDPARYAETWARDGGARPGEPEFESLMQAWLRDFAERRVVAVGLGSIRARRSGERDVIRVEHLAGAFSTNPGAELSAAFDAGVDASLMSEEEVLARRWLRAPSIAEVREHEPGHEAPRSIVLRTDRPVERAIAVDPLLAAAVGACDGELELGRIAGALATIFEVDEAEVARALVVDVRELAWLGMLAPAAR